MKPSTSQKEVQQFIDVVHYHPDMWERLSYTLAPLTKIMSSKVKLGCIKIKIDAFGEINRIVARNTLLTYLDFNEGFKIHNYASNFQLGEVIIQKGKLIALYGRKFTDYQRRYTVTLRGLLSIVETLKEFITILVG